MKKIFFAALCLGIVIVACNKEKSTPVATPSKSTLQPHHLAARYYPDSTDTINSKFIPVSMANEMINSYLYSINASSDDTDLKSFSINADTLRAYLSLTGVKNVKLIFAHTMAYISSGNYGVPAGYQSGAITLIIAGYDASGNYVFYNGNYVLDHLVPCPYTCPPGNAGENLLE